MRNTTIDARNINAVETAEDFAALLGQELLEVLDGGPVTKSALWRATIHANIRVTDAKNLHRIDQDDVQRLRAGISATYRRALRDLAAAAR